MVRNRNWQKEEIILLSEFVKTNRPKLYGKAHHCSSRVEKRKEKAWVKASALLNSNGFARSPKQTKKKWSDIRICANRYEGQKKLTGGGPSVKINPVYEAVLSAIAPQSREGISSGEEAGFGSSDESECSESEVAVSLLKGMMEPAADIGSPSPTTATTPAPTTATTPAPTTATTPAPTTSTTPAPTTATTPAPTTATTTAPMTATTPATSTATKPAPTTAAKPASTTATTPASTSTTPAAISTTSRRAQSARSSVTPVSQTAGLLAAQLEVDRERLHVEQENLSLRMKEFSLQKERMLMKKEKMEIMKEMLIILRKMSKNEA